MPAPRTAQLAWLVSAEKKLDTFGNEIKQEVKSKFELTMPSVLLLQYTEYLFDTAVKLLVTFTQSIAKFNEQKVRSLLAVVLFA